MAVGFEYFDSSQSGAPGLWGAAGRMRAVLDWVLVDKGGWAKPYTGTNLAVYRSDSGNRFYLRLDDTQSMQVRLRGYRAMTAVSTGTGQFPQSAVTTSTYGCKKSDEASTATRRYWGIRTNRYFVMFIEIGDYTMGLAARQMIAFGDVPSLFTSDSFNTILIACDAGVVGDSPFPGSSMCLAGASPAGQSVVQCLAFAASSTGATASPRQAFIAVPWQVIGGYTVYPGPVGSEDSGGLHYAEYMLCAAEAAGDTYQACNPRARLPGLRYGWGLAPRTNLADLEVFTETATGRNLKVMTSYSPGEPVSYSHPFGLLITNDVDGAL